jgi:T-complex protein 1 subunit eta
MSFMMQPRIVLLKEGTDSSQGKGQLISNINAVQAIFDILKTTLGPRGMDKLIHDGQHVTISNDGATIISLLDIVHPAAKTLVDIAKSQDAEVGDGTTTVCLLAGEILKNIKMFIEDGLHPQVIIRGFRLACAEALAHLRRLAVDVEKKEEGKTREMLLRCAGTALNSKLISGQKGFFSEMCVDAVQHLEKEMDLQLIGVKKVPGGSVTDSFLVPGVAFKKTFSYAGFEQQPKSFTDPRIVLLNVELELKNERQNAEVRIADPTQYQSIVDAEWDIIYGKLAKIVDSGARIVLSRQPIGDLATQYFADRNVFCAGRVPQDDLERTAQATGGVIQTSLSDLKAAGVLGSCKKFEERQVGSERFNFFQGCPRARACTIILRGGAEQFIAEAERSMHDAMMIVKRAVQHAQVVGGGGAIEMELSRHLRTYSAGIANKTQLVVLAFAKSLEIIPRQLAENAGFDAIDTVNALRAQHAKEGGRWMGVDIENEGTCDTMKSFVWEPALVKANALAAATEAACMILSVDETIRNPRSGGQEDNRVPAAAMRGRGMRR